MPGARSWGQRVVGSIEDHEFDDPGVGVLRIAQEYRPQLIGVGPEEFAPATREGAVEQLDESQPVAPESQRSLDVGGADRRMMNTQHSLAPASSARKSHDGASLGVEPTRGARIRAARSGRQLELEVHSL